MVRSHLDGLSKGNNAPAAIVAPILGADPHGAPGQLSVDGEFVVVHNQLGVLARRNHEDCG